MESIRLTDEPSQQQQNVHRRNQLGNGTNIKKQAKHLNKKLNKKMVHQNEASEKIVR